MVKSTRLGATLTAIGLVGALAACSTTGSKTAMTGTTLFGEKVDTANIGLATRAQLALAANDIPTAINLAERAVANRADDAGFRALLGNCYLAAGRFASAEAAYTDSLTLIGNQPQVALKLALVQIALGKPGQAASLLAEAQTILDPSDLGLALALAGRPDQAIQILDPAARAVGADARVSQNLALAHALSGDWQAARTIAAQDVPADQLDGRIQQWMTLAKPGQKGAAVASFIGVTPAATDQGQPIRLALNKEQAKQRLADATMPIAPVAAAQPIAAPPEVAIAAPAPAPAAYVPASAPAVVPLVATEPVEEAVAPPLPVQLAETAPVKVAAPVRHASIRAPRPALSPAATRLTETLPQLRHAALAVTGSRSKAVVQLGAYSSRGRIAVAWSHATGQYASLRHYQPMTARFDGAKGTFYRLSVKGFGSEREAINLCQSLKRAGRNCFVRAAFNDAPVQFASN